MTVSRLVLSIAVVLFAAYVAAANWGCAIVSMRNKRRGIHRHHSTVPLFSLFLAVIALILYPYHPAPHGASAHGGMPDNSLWMLAVPLLDIGNWVLLLLPVMLIRQLMAGKSNKSAESKVTAESHYGDETASGLVAWSGGATEGEDHSSFSELSVVAMSIARSYKDIATPTASRRSRAN